MAHATAPRDVLSDVLFAGFVLAGGASTRMGGSKEMARLWGRPMVHWPAAALSDAGAVEVAVVGGSTSIEGEELTRHPDSVPGHGPLGGIATALALLPRSCDVAVVLGCDMPCVRPDTITTLVRRLDDATVSDDPPPVAAIAVAGRVRQPLLGAWSRHALPSVVAAVEGGEASPRRFLATCGVVEVEVDEAEAASVDDPEHLARLDQIGPGGCGW